MNETFLVSRRQVLATAAVVSGSTLAGSTTSLIQAAEGSCEIKPFENLLGAEFSIRNGSAIGTVTLKEVKRHPRITGVAAVRQQPFSLLLSGGAQWTFQGNCELTHPELGTISLYLHPVGEIARKLPLFEAFIA